MARRPSFAARRDSRHAHLARLAGKGIIGGGGGPNPSARLTILAGGQSLMAYIFQRGAPDPSAKIWAEELRALAGLPATNPVGRYDQARFFHDGSSQTATDWGVRLDCTASGGASLFSVALSINTSNASTGNDYGEVGNYWYNEAGIDNSAATGNAADNNSAGSTASPGPLARKEVQRIAALRAGGATISAYAWSQGTADTTSDPTKLATYKAQLKAHFGNVRAAAGNAALPIFIHRIHRHQVTADAAIEGIRQVQREVVQEMAPNVHIAAEEYPQRMALARQTTGCTITAGSNVVQMASTSFFQVNQRVVGPGIPTNAFVQSLVANTSITLGMRVKDQVLPANATASASNATVFTGDNVHLYPGISPGQEPFDYAGGTQNDPFQGSSLMVRQSARLIAKVLGLKNAPAEARGPYVSAASFTRGSTTLRATFTHAAGSDLANVGDSVGWRVVVDGVAATVTNAVRVDATHVDLTVSKALNPSDTGTGVTVQYAWGSMVRAVPEQFITDNASPYPYPVQARSAVSVVVVEPGYHARTQRILTVMGANGGAPGASRRYAIDARVRAWEAAGGYAKVDRDVVMAAHAQGAALINWANPEAGLMTLVGTPTFTVDRGFTDATNGAAIKVDFGYNPSSGGVLLIQNDAMLSEFVLSTGTYAGFDIADASGRANLKGRQSTAAQMRLNASTVTSFTEAATAPFKISALRRASDAQLGFRNGAQVVSGAVASVGLPGAIQLVCSDRVIPMAALGAAPDDATMAALYQADLDYLKNIGAVA